MKIVQEQGSLEKNERNNKAVNFFIAVFYSVNKQTITELS